MTIRDTSREAYEELIKSGKLKGQLADILRYVAGMCDPVTSAEAVHGTKYARNLNCTRARFTELRERGLIREMGQRKCKITGRNAITWAYTERTTPLEETRKRPKVSAKRWKMIAAQLVAAIDDAASTPEISKAIDAYRAAGGS